MMRRSIAGLGLATILAFALPAAAQEKAEVIHWWTSASESAGARVFAEQFRKAGGSWTDNAIAGGVNARTAAINRIIGGDPPTASQFNTGKQFDELVENDLLSNVDSVAAAQNWKGVIPAPILDAVLRNKHYYAVPVNIHGQNWLFYSSAALQKAGATAPTNWDDIFPALDKLKASGVVPLAFAAGKNWERLLFNAVLAGKGGSELYVAFWGKHDQATVKSPQFRAVAETFRRLHNYIDQGAASRTWNDASGMVIQAKAGMQVMGDWAKGEFSAAGQTPGQEYGCTVLSNDGMSYIMGGDVFVFPKNPKAAKAQDMLARVLLDPATQIEFARKKGSIPVRQDLDSSSLDLCAQKAMAWIKDPAAQIPADALLSPPALTGAVEDVLSQFWNDGSMSVDSFITRVGAALGQRY